MIMQVYRTCMALSLAIYASLVLIATKDPDAGPIIILLAIAISCLVLAVVIFRFRPRTALSRIGFGLTGLVLAVLLILISFGGMVFYDNSAIVYWQ